jgi:predicted HAD superfamily Cof-like phosphohydrolase
MSLSNFEKVIEFMTYSGQEVNTIERPDLMDNNDLINLRIKLIEEEINEYIDANKVNDNIEMLDAIVDTLYVVYGTGVSFGINLDKLYNTFILNKVKNSSLILGMTNYEKTKFISTNNSNFNSNDISDILLNNLDQIKHSFNLAKSFDLVKSSLLNILFTLYNYNYNYNYPCKLLNSQELVNLDKAFDLVHISNMTKFCKSEEEAINTVNKYKSDSNSKYKNISYKRINNLYIIYDSDTGKTLKSINYVPVNLTKLVS